AKMLYSAVAYGSSLRLFLWLVIGLSAAIGLDLFVRVAPVLFGIIVVAIVLWLGFAWMPSTRLTAYGARIAVWCTPAAVRLLGLLNPLFSRVTAWWHRRVPILRHSGLYEQEDLVELIERQKAQPDNRIAAEVLDLMLHALHFNERFVRDVVTPRKSVRALSARAMVGPVLLDELHATGHTRFPVYDKSPDNIVGTLQLMTLDEAKAGGKVSSYMDRSVVFLHEADSLAEALQAVYHTRQQLFVVVNDFGEYAGVVTLEDVLEQLVGRPGHTGFSAHRSREAVAAKHTAHESSQETSEVLLPAAPALKSEENTSESAKTVVE
ncbi:MAG TPA: CBS domain-containing protein, partial [Candidatus Saccharimonadales bacterium]